VALQLGAIVLMLATLGAGSSWVSHRSAQRWPLKGFLAAFVVTTGLMAAAGTWRVASARAAMGAPIDASAYPTLFVYLVGFLVISMGAAHLVAWRSRDSRFTFRVAVSTAGAAVAGAAVFMIAFALFDLFGVSLDLERVLRT
jgi:hypothetical protein